jgi:hypothetical protein
VLIEIASLVLVALLFAVQTALVGGGNAKADRRLPVIRFVWGAL